MDDFQRELSEIQGQRTAAWAQERLGRFTASQFSSLMAQGRGGTKTRRDRLEKQLKAEKITNEAYLEEIQDCDRLDYEAKFGDGCRTYVFEKVAELLIGAPHMTGGSAATEWGTENEAQAVHHYELDRGVKVEPIGFVTFEDYAGGSPDGRVPAKYDPLGEGIIEVKCPYNPANHLKVLVLEELYNKDHFWQCQGNMLATGAKYCDFISYDPRVQEDALKMAVVRLVRDEVIMDQLRTRISEVRQFMVDMIQSHPHLKLIL